MMSFQSGSRTGCFLPTTAGWGKLKIRFSDRQRELALEQQWNKKRRWLFLTAHADATHWTRRSHLQLMSLYTELQCHLDSFHGKTYEGLWHFCTQTVISIKSSMQTSQSFLIKAIKKSWPWSPIVAIFSRILIQAPWSHVLVGSYIPSPSCLHAYLRSLQWGHSTN